MMSMALPAPDWYRQCLGGGAVDESDRLITMRLPTVQSQRYADAEINDYMGLRAGKFAWCPPVRLTLRARASHPAAPVENSDPSADALRGTAGFGFWNAPFLLAKRVGRLPDAVWFLYASPPGNLALVPDIPGWGWKAQVVHAHRWQTLATAPPTAAALAWARLGHNERPAARWLQRLTGAHEAPLTAALTAWHAYRLDWLPDRAAFYVDDALALAIPRPPQGPLGFVAWLDNQYAIVTPRGVFRSGVLQTESQWLEIADLTITVLGPTDA
jgi:hypothetical protein